MSVNTPSFIIEINVTFHRIIAQDLPSLMNLHCVIRITWQEEIATRTFQEYCYLPGRGIEKGSIYQKK